MFIAYPKAAEFVKKYPAISPIPTKTIRITMQPIPSDGKPTILVVEDNPQIHRFIAESLAKDFKLIPAVDGRQGLEKAGYFFTNSAAFE